MAASTWSLPDCSGRCRCSQTAGVSAMAAMVSGRRSLGWGLVKRTRLMPSTAPMALRSSAKRGRRLLEDLDHGTVLSGVVQEVGGSAHVVGAEHDVDVRGLLADEARVLLGQAAGDRDL